MRYHHARERYKSSMHFNLTPLIDIIFLLNMFFMLACSFIIFKNYQVHIPEDCPAAVLPDKVKESTVTISVFPGGAKSEGAAEAEKIGGVIFAIREEKYELTPARGPAQGLINELAQAIQRQAGANPDQLVHLRADRDLEYKDVQHALRALSQAGQKRIQLAAFQNEPGGGQ